MPTLNEIRESLEQARSKHNDLLEKFGGDDDSPQLHADILTSDKEVSDLIAQFEAAKVVDEKQAAEEARQAEAVIGAGSNIHKDMASMIADKVGKVDDVWDELRRGAEIELDEEVFARQFGLGAQYSALGKDIYADVATLPYTSNLPDAPRDRADGDFLTPSDNELPFSFLDVVPSDFESELVHSYYTVSRGDDRPVTKNQGQDSTELDYGVTLIDEKLVELPAYIPVERRMLRTLPGIRRVLNDSLRAELRLVTNAAIKSAIDANTTVQNVTEANADKMGEVFLRLLTPLLTLAFGV